jgi:V8-like Glu-specific endopeptidase
MSRSAGNRRGIAAWCAAAWCAATLAAAIGVMPSQAALGAARQSQATAFAGMPAVGALFVVRNGRLRHFCTAAVVRSPRRDLVITAAHCLLGRRLGLHGNVKFAPDYHDGRFPKGVWTVMSEIVDSAWRRHHDPNDDVAFLVIGRGRRQIQDSTGAEILRTSIRLPQLVEVIGYPNSTQEPVRCSAEATVLHLPGYRQMVFVCGGYTNGTSGGPFLEDVSPRTGDGYVVGVIGGYQEGGDLPSVSYSARFLRNVAALYRQAVSQPG